MIRQVIMFGFAGAAGTLSRFFLGNVFQKFSVNGFPYGTLMVNMLGCLFIGFLGTLADEKMVLSPNMKLLLMSGFLGAFTTFSSFSYETWILFKNDQVLYAFANVAASLLLGFAGLALGILLGRAAA